MQEKLKIPTLEEAKSYIDSIDFSMIIDKVIKTKKWARKDVEKIAKLYRHFLFLNKKYRECNLPIPPSEEIDEFWHNHILDTKKYMLDCDKIFGYYLHHYPYLGIDGKTNEEEADNLFEKTQELHLKEFGDYICTIRNARIKQFINFGNSLISSLKSKK